MNNGQLSAQMAFPLQPPERIRGSPPPLGALHRRGPLHPRRLPDPRTQVHTQLLQHLPQQPVREPAISIPSRQLHDLCHPSSRDYYQGSADIDRVYVQR